jgi:hypothetical protein
VKRRFVPTLKRIRSVRPYVPGISHLSIAATPAHEARLVAETTRVQAELDRLARDRERIRKESHAH